MNERLTPKELKELTKSNESKLKQRLVTFLRKEFAFAVVLRHEERFVAGVPDISITTHYTTIWIEAKYAAPVIHMRGEQDLTMMRIARVSHAFYVVWEEAFPYDVSEVVSKQQTIIASPWEVSKPGNGAVCEGLRTNGFDHRFVADHIRRLYDHHRS